MVTVFYLFIFKLTASRVCSASIFSPLAFAIAALFFGEECAH